MLQGTEEQKATLPLSVVEPFRVNDCAIKKLNLIFISFYM